MTRILNVVPRTIMLVFCTVFLALFGCSQPSGGGGGGGGVLCALDGSCPAGMTCAGQVCVFVSADAVADSTAGSQDTTTVDSGAQDTGSVDAGPADTGTTDTGSPDTTTATPDTSTPDTSTPSGSQIATLQQATSSKTCAKTDGELSVMSDVTLSGVIVTTDAAPLGKLMVFYVRPADAPNTDGRWQGMKVVVFKDKTQVKAGDIVTITGELVEYYCESEIKVDSDKITVTGKANLAPVPYDVVVAEISGKGLQSEAYEGVFVRLNGVEVAEPNVLGTDGKPHGQFSVASAGGTTPTVVIGGSAGTSFTAKDPKTGNTITTMKKGQAFKSITGHLTYSFETYVLRPSTDADLVAQ
ncbi:MAG: hypothetical protein KC502_21045 [Myxococcales bacterium]|nr:hypothetical protein [Myxococcales bacterium]